MPAFSERINLAFKRRSFRLGRNYVFRRLFDRKHIVRKYASYRTHYAAFFRFYFGYSFPEHSRLHFSHYRARYFRQFVKRIPRSVIQSDYSVVVHYGGIERDKSFERRSVRIFNVSVKLVFSVRRIAYRYAYRTVITAVTFVTAQTVVQIIPSVVSFYAVGRVHICVFFCRKRILFCPIVYTFACPIG